MKFIWLHGFASGPGSGKGQFVAARLRERGVSLLLPDLNQPLFAGLTVTRMLGVVDALAGAEEVVLFGSSLGGFTAATWAATRGRALRLVLLAPAFDLAARWEARMGQAEVARWRAQGSFAFEHYARGRKEELSVAFLEDARRQAPFPLPSCPTLVLQGTRDEVVDAALARAFVRRMQGRAELVELAQGHELNADLPLLWQLIEPRLRPFLDQPARPTPK